MQRIKTLAIGIAASLALSAPAHALEIDLTGVQADGAALNTFTVPNSDTNPVIDVTFEFIYDAGNSGNASWGSELIVEVLHVNSATAGLIGTQIRSCDDFGVICDYDLGWGDSSGVFNATGGFSFASSIADGSGDWRITVGDSFDDAGIDGVFLAGSFLSINQEDSDPVPAPATLLLLGLGMTGLGMARRRRTS